MHCRKPWIPTLLRLLLSALCCCSLVCGRPVDGFYGDDRVVRVTNGSRPFEKFVELENVGAVPHKIDVAFEAIGLPPGSGRPPARYAITDVSPPDTAGPGAADNVTVGHPKDSLGANVMPGETVTLHVVRLADETCVHAEDTLTGTCLEACGCGAFRMRNASAQGVCPPKYVAVASDETEEQCRDGSTDLARCPGATARVWLQVRVKVPPGAAPPAGGAMSAAVAEQQQRRRQQPLRHAAAPPVGGMDFRAARALQALNDGWYNATNGLWDGTGLPHGAQWWNSANSLEVLCNFEAYGGATGVADLALTLDNTFDKTSLADTLTGRYDDEAWWSLAWIRAYELTGQQAYLTRADEIFAHLAADAWDDTCGGGCWWSYRKQYKNAITNELFLMMAIKLHEHMPSGATPTTANNNTTATTSSNSSNSGKTYLAWAQETWDWFNRSAMINARHLVNDGLVLGTCKNNNQTEWTYNQGVILGGLAYLYNATGDTALLDTAMAIAEAAIAHLTFPGGVLSESCDRADGTSSCDADQEQFKGIFVRYLHYFTSQPGGLPAKFAPRQQALEEWTQHNAASVWTTDRDASGTTDHLGEVWMGPFRAPGAVVQTSALDVLVSASAIAAGAGTRGGQDV